MKYKLVQIEWWDTVVRPHWTDIDKARNHQPQLMRTIGYLLNETPTKMVISGTVGDDIVGQTVTIPKQWVKQKRVIQGYDYTINPTAQ